MIWQLNFQIQSFLVRITSKIFNFRKEFCSCFLVSMTSKFFNFWRELVRKIFVFLFSFLVSYLMFVFLLSEPPDIGNWFPDYVYESPVLGTSDEFRDILSTERESDEDNFAVEDNNREEQDEIRV